MIAAARPRAPAEVIAQENRVPTWRGGVGPASAMAVMTAMSRFGDPLQLTSLRPTTLPPSSTKKSTMPCLLARSMLSAGLSCKCALIIP